MTRLLIIITHPTKDEFTNYWNSKDGLSTNEVAVKIVNGKGFRNYTDQNFGNRILDNLKSIKLADYSEIGVISHGGGTPKIVTLRQNTANISFNAKYSSQMEDLCNHEGDNFTTSGDRSKPLDAVRDAVVNIIEMVGFSKKFNNLWKFFSGDPILEAKLNLLHQCLTPEGAKTANGVKNFHQIKAKIEEVQISNEEKDKESMNVLDFLSKQENPYDKKYLDAIIQLRDKLLTDYAINH